MSRTPTVQTVLIVDDDIGFMLWASGILAAADYRSVPASSCRQAVDHLKQLDVVADIAIVNPALVGVSELLQILSQENPRLKIVAIREAVADSQAAISGCASLEKPCDPGQIPREEWFRKLMDVLKGTPQLASGAQTAD